MGIRPIDLQILYTKASDVEKIQQQQQTAEKAAPQQIAHDLQVKKEIENKQVAKSNTTERKKVDEKQERQKKRPDQDDGKEKDEKKEEKKSIDIRV